MNLNPDFIRNVQMSVEFGTMVFTGMSLVLATYVLFNPHGRWVKMLAGLILVLGTLSLFYQGFVFYDYYFAPRIMT